MRGPTVMVGVFKENQQTTLNGQFESNQEKNTASGLVSEKLEPT